MVYDNTGTLKRGTCLFCDSQQVTLNAPDYKREVMLKKKSDGWYPISSYTGTDTLTIDCFECGTIMPLDDYTEMVRE